jgi:uncharacterized protein YceK
MKNTTSLIVILLAAFASGGCQNATTHTAANNGASTTAANDTQAANTSKPAAATPTAPPDLPTSNLKPEDIDLNKPVPAEELRNAVFGDEDAWIGKEVTVVGTYNGHTTSKLDSGEHYSVSIVNAKGKEVIPCDGRKAPPVDLKDKREGRVFKGTVKSINRSWQRLTLEPCEVVK